MQNIAMDRGFVIAADVSSPFHAPRGEGSQGRVSVILTAGVGDPIDYRYNNTINSIVITDIKLTETAMVNLFIVVTEAKTASR